MVDELSHAGNICSGECKPGHSGTYIYCFFQHETEVDSEISSGLSCYRLYISSRYSSHDNTQVSSGSVR